MKLIKDVNKADNLLNLAINQGQKQWRSVHSKNNLDRIKIKLLLK